ncbi:rps4 [Symbiodinium natans]|uniref:Rps4 protein n=1 Tax=Symbiodinium natans TaxID=878477 RepID=A0A812U6Y7_9DINO|nr:rps4 [Symbiodinium natans]
MARGIIKHLKRMYAPKHWMLDKLRGRWAPKPNAGPHKLRECLPLIAAGRYTPEVLGAQPTRAKF